MPSSGAIVSALRSNLPYNLEHDLVPISLVAVQSLVLVVHPSLPVRNVKELIAFARARPGQLSYASNGVGSVNAFRGRAVQLHGAAKNRSCTLQKGSAESAIATLSGEVEMSYPGLASASLNWKVTN